MTAAVSASSVPPAEREVPRICVLAAADVPTRFGQFRVHVFSPESARIEHVAVVHGDVRGAGRVPVRIHSECLTGEVFGSCRCDCREQLHLALEHVGRSPCGIVLYLRQEGRGIGLTSKIQAYALQVERGLDTVDANLALGYRDDERDYGVAAAMLDRLGVRSISLLTNNPTKINALRELGVEIDERLPLAVRPGVHNREYLETKARRSGHLLDLFDPSGL